MAEGCSQQPVHAKSFLGVCKSIANLLKENSQLKETIHHQNELLASQENATGSDCEDRILERTTQKPHMTEWTYKLVRYAGASSHRKVAELNIVPDKLTSSISLHVNRTQYHDKQCTTTATVELSFRYIIAPQNSKHSKDKFSYYCEVALTLKGSRGKNKSSVIGRLIAEDKTESVTTTYAELADSVQTVITYSSVHGVSPAGTQLDTPGCDVIKHLSGSSHAQRALDSCIGSDCEFLVGDENPKLLRAAKVILAVKSPVFEAMFYGSWPQSEGPIRIPDVEPNIFYLFLRAAYGCDVTKAMESSSIVEKLYYVAHKYHYSELMDSCVKFLTPEVVDNKFWSALHVATYYGHDGLWKDIVRILTKSSKSVLTSPQFVTISQESLLAILRQPVMDVPEDVVLDAVLAWGRTRCQEKYLQETGRTLRMEIGDVISFVRLLSIDNKVLLKKQDEFHFLKNEDFVNLMIMKSSDPARKFSSNICPSRLPRNNGNNEYSLLWD